MRGKRNIIKTNGIMMCFILGVLFQCEDVLCCMLGKNMKQVQEQDTFDPLHINIPQMNSATNEANIFFKFHEND